ncbi:hypothetical protein M8J75_009225 [Diaphorina citri]|nr:hypothetical protein M8J75_009225 [Diaphorina citri]
MTPVDYHPPRPPHEDTSCCGYTTSHKCSDSLSSLLSTLGILLLVLTYTVLGALTFMSLEATPPPDPTTIDPAKPMDPGTKTTASVGSGHNRTLSSTPSTLATPSGRYGTVSAKTLWGRITTILYTLVGIPLMLIYLSLIGESLANTFRSFYGKLTKQTQRKSKQQQQQQQQNSLPNIYSQFNHISTGKYDGKTTPYRGGYCTHASDFEPKVRVPIAVSFLIIISFILLGSLIFNKLENWTFLDGTFFCFTSLGTIGFGELIPGESYDRTLRGNKNISVLVSSSYILVGMAVISMCFNLIQEEIIFMIKKFTLKLNKSGGSSGGVCDKNCDIS